MRSVVAAAALLGNSAVMALAPRDTCAVLCYSTFQTCVKNAGVPTDAWCVSQITTCLGHAPEIKNGQVVPPTECGPGTTTTSTVATSTTINPPPASTTTAPSGDDCATKCMNVFNPCVSNAGVPNDAWCVNQLSKCVGYTPEQQNGHIVAPTTCKTSPPCTTTTSAPSGDSCATQCMNVFNPCVANAGVPNDAWCVSQLTKCIGYAPEQKDGHIVPPTTCKGGSPSGGATNGTTTTHATGAPVPTAAAGQLQPALFLAALGAAALL